VRSISGSRARSAPISASRRRALSHRFTLDEVNRGFELMEAQDGIRSVIVFE